MNEEYTQIDGDNVYHVRSWGRGAAVGVIREHVGKVPSSRRSRWRVAYGIAARPRFSLVDLVLWVTLGGWAFREYGLAAGVVTVAAVAWLLGKIEGKVTNG